MKTADAIFYVLKEHVDTVFFVPGGQAMYLVDALGRSGLQHISMTSEAGAGFAAIGYAMAHGFGVVLTTSGPGALDAVGACGAAWMDSVPVLFISGNARSDTLIGNSGLRTRGNQEVDIVSVVKPITKYAEQGLMNGPSFPELIYAALAARQGPVWLDIPLDVQNEEVR